PTPATQQSVSIAETLALPAADYKAVIPDLMPFRETVNAPVQVGHVSSVTPVYGSDRKEAVARIDPTDFLGKQAPVVVVDQRGAWSKILTPARVTLPSTSNAVAPAQSAGWVKSSAVQSLRTVRERVDVDLTARTLTVTNAAGETSVFEVGIGTDTTPTPSAVSGYLEARYVDPSQGTGDQPIQLTSLHSETQDTPVPGSAGGVIAAHYYDARTGAVSHGCLRLAADAIAAIDALPLGSIVTVTP
ncbi:MAG: L,D-transpeptidase, partial [Curtobacterium sp.]